MKKKLAIVLALVALTGCATFNKIVTNNMLISELAVESATARVLHEHPTWKDKTISITDSIIASIDNKTVVNLGSIEDYVRKNINWSRLSPEEHVLLSTLITQVRQNLEDSFRANKIADPSAQLVEVRQVMQWIHDTAKAS